MTLALANRSIEAKQATISPVGLEHSERVLGKSLLEKPFLPN